MPKHGTPSTQPSGAYLNFVAAVIKALPRDITDDQAELMAESGRWLQRTLRPLARSYGGIMVGPQHSLPCDLLPIPSGYGWDYVRTRAPQDACMDEVAGKLVITFWKRISPAIRRTYCFAFPDWPHESGNGVTCLREYNGEPVTFCSVTVPDDCFILRHNNTPHE